MNQMELSFSAKIENESFARTSIGSFIASNIIIMVIILVVDAGNSFLSAFLL